VLEDAGDQAGLAKAWHLLSEVENTEGKQGASIEALERALEHARRSGDAKLAANAAGYLGSRMFFGPTLPEDGIRRCEEFREEFKGNRDLEAAMLRSIGRLEGLQGRFEDARMRISESLAILEDLGLGFTIALTKGFASALVEQLAGDLDAAERDLRDAIGFLTRMGEKGAASSLAAVLAAVLYERGDYDAAEPWTRTSEEWASEDDTASQMLWRSIRGKILARLGDLEAGERLAREAIEIAEGTDFGWRGDEFRDLAEILRLAGRSSEAMPFAQRALELYEKKGNVPDAERARNVLTELRANG
jgi:tetratricopeptide (TPR) repeat protein